MMQELNGGSGEDRTRATLSGGPSVSNRAHYHSATLPYDVFILIHDGQRMILYLGEVNPLLIDHHLFVSHEHLALVHLEDRDLAAVFGHQRPQALGAEDRLQLLDAGERKAQPSTIRVCLPYLPQLRIGRRIAVGVLWRARSVVAAVVIDQFGHSESAFAPALETAMEIAVVKHVTENDSVKLHDINPS